MKLCGFLVRGRRKIMDYVNEEIHKKEVNTDISGKPRLDPDNLPNFMYLLQRETCYATSPSATSELSLINLHT